MLHARVGDQLESDPEVLFFFASSSGFFAVVSSLLVELDSPSGFFWCAGLLVSVCHIDFKNPSFLCDSGSLGSVDEDDA